MIAISNAISIGLNRLGGGGPGPGPDPDAQAFFDRVAAAGGVLTEAETTAVNQLVLDMKTNGIWSSMKAIYPIVGASAAACSRNLKSDTFNATFSSGWAFASNGITGNGTSTFMNTNLSPNTTMNFNSQSYFIYKTSIQSNLACEFGVVDVGICGVQLFLFDGYATINEFVLQAPFSSNTTNGAYILNRNNTNDKKLFKNGSLFETRNNAATNFTLGNMYLGARNSNGGAIANTNTQTRFFSIGDGLTNTQASNFYTAVQIFNTTLNRQVGAPLYDNGTLLLDTYASAAAAYSVRKLRNNYVGGPIRVRRSSDNAEQDIYFNSAGDLDTSALTTFCSGTNGFVTTWYDQSGNARNLTQATAIYQPQIVSSGSVVLENGKPTINFASKFISSTAFSSAISQPNTYFITVNKINHSGYLFETVGSPRQAQGDDNWVFAGSVALGFYPNADLGSQKLLTILFNGASSISRINSTATGSGNPGSNGQGGLAIGRSPSGVNAKLQEFIIYPTNQTSNFSGIESNINSYYAIY